MFTKDVTRDPVLLGSLHYYLPTPHSNHPCTEVDERGSLHSIKQELRSIWLVIGWIRYLGRDFCFKMQTPVVAFWYFLQMPCSICFVILRRYTLTKHSRSAPCNFSPSMDSSMASSFLWFMPYCHPRPERITTGCLLTSKKSYRIETCRESTECDGWFRACSNPISQDAVLLPFLTVSMEEGPGSWENIQLTPINK